MLEISKKKKHLFMSIAEQMGSTPQKTTTREHQGAVLDLSCAVFDRDGQLSHTRPQCPCIWDRWAERADHHPGNAPGQTATGRPSSC